MADIIQINKLFKDYYLGKQVVPVLKGINLNIRENEYAALMGPSGSGKSTLMNIIGCLDTPTGGDYMLNNQRISSLKEKELAKIRSAEIGFVFQQFNLLPRLSALENVALPLIYAGVGKRKRENIAKDMLSMVDLADRWHHKPNELSGGQNQRVAIARALANNPSIILADEPTGNLDTKTSNEIMDIFEELNDKGHTIVLVTHEEEIALRAKRIIRLRDGLIESNESSVKRANSPESRTAVRDTSPIIIENEESTIALKEKPNEEEDQLKKYGSPPVEAEPQVERVEFDESLPIEENLELAKEDEEVDLNSVEVHEKIEEEVALAHEEEQEEEESLV